ncbi:SDR family oxidoreductase [Methyloraptor flagellatus]|uniref:SDR family oxidoreductase n=1 Tax=Methyloraptor flagellatus TaxID=3162530 RepID=A0AAU7XFU2_9HYPH
MAVDDLYDRLTGLGLVYGPRMRGLRRLRVRGAGDDRIVVAEIEAPDGATEAAVFDAALQATLALDPDLGDGAPPLPYALDEVTLHGPLPKRAIAVVRLAAGSGPAVRKVDLDIAAEDGTIFAALRGLAGRAATELRGTDDAAVAGHANRSEIPAAGTGTILLTPVWEPATPAGERPWPAANEAVAVLGDGPIAEAFAHALPDARRLILPAGADEAEVARRIGDLGALDHLVWALGDPGGDGRPAPGLVTGQEDGVLRGFRIAKALIALGYATRPFGWTTTTVAAAPTRGDEPIDPTHASIHGLLGSLAKEFSPAWRLRVLDLPRAGSDASAAALVAAALRATEDPGGDVLALRDGGWLRRALVPSRFAAPTAPVYRDDGVYVVLGGAGGIGAVWTEHVVRRHGARVAWIGRRAEDDGIRAVIARIGKVGPAPIYIAADATDPAAMERVRDTVRDRLGPVTGIVHSALVLQDASLARMDEATFRAALAAKVDASVHLAAAFAREPLETAIFFSSMMSFAKSAGQANYAAGCTFVDAFAHAFGHATGIPAKIINWGFWGSVGVVATDIHRERMRRYGFGSVEPEEGMAALETLLAAPVGQVAFLKTERALTRDVDGVTDDTLIALPNQAPPVLAGLELFGRTRHG